MVNILVYFLKKLNGNVLIGALTVWYRKSTAVSARCDAEKPNAH